MLGHARAVHLSEALLIQGAQSRSIRPKMREFEQLFLGRLSISLPEEIIGIDWALEIGRNFLDHTKEGAR